MNSTVILEEKATELKNLVAEIEDLETEKSAFGFIKEFEERKIKEYQNRINEIIKTL